MYYTYRKEGFTKFYPLDVSRVKEILRMNRKGTKPMELVSKKYDIDMTPPERDYADVTGEIELADLEKNQKPRRRRRKRGGKKNNNQENSNRTKGNNPNSSKENQPKNKTKRTNNSPNRRTNKPSNKSRTTTELSTPSTN